MQRNYALQEIGADFLNFNEDWFGTVLQPFLKANKIAYFATWRNANRGDVETKKNPNYVKEYYLPFLPDFKFKNSIQEEIKTMSYGEYIKNLKANSAFDLYIDYIDEATYEVAKKGLANKKPNEADPITAPPAESPYISNFKTFAKAENIITLSKIKTLVK